MAARVLALLAAVAMVVAAMSVRSRVDESTGEAGAPLRLTCSTELEAVCAALAAASPDRVRMTTEPAGATAERLVAATADIGLDAWLVPAPWPEIVDSARERATRPRLFAKAVDPVARSPLVIVGWAQRLAALEGSACSGGISYRCIGDAAAKRDWAALGGRPEWGPFKPFQADPRRDASGLLALAAETVGFLGRADVSSTDLEEDAYLAWIGGIEDSLSDPSSTAGVAVQRLLTQGPAGFDVVIALESDAGPQVAASARGDEVRLIYPSPVVTADVVLARRATRDRAEHIADLLADAAGKRALAETGWRVEGETPPPGVRRDRLPSGNGLPPAGFLEALQRTWGEVSR